MPSVGQEGGTLGGAVASEVKQTGFLSEQIKQIIRKNRRFYLAPMRSEVPAVGQVETIKGMRTISVHLFYTAQKQKKLRNLILSTS